MQSAIPRAALTQEVLLRSEQYHLQLCEPPALRRRSVRPNIVSSGFHVAIRIAHSQDNRSPTIDRVPLDPFDNVGGRKWHIVGDVHSKAVGFLIDRTALATPCERAEWRSGTLFSETTRAIDRQDIRPIWYGREFYTMLAASRRG